MDEYIGENYNRIRIGIDHPGHKDLVSNYVLNNFKKLEKELLEKKFEKIIENFDLLLSNTPLFLTKIAEVK